MTGQPPSPGKREANRAAVRRRIEDALLATLAEGDPGGVNHDAIAARAGVGRRTVYRYFPDREALLRAGWHRLNSEAGPNVGTLLSAQGMLDGMEEMFTGFERNAAAMTVTMASAEGRAIRNSMTAQRVATYRSILTEQTAHLDPHRRDLALAAIQLLNSGFAWREYRDQWQLSGKDMARASRWAIDTLLRDLAEGNGP